MEPKQENSKRESQPSFEEQLKNRIEFLDPHKGSFLRLYIKWSLSDEARRVLEEYEFTVVPALSVSELKTDAIQQFILSSQYISYQNKLEKIKPHLPFRVALVTTRDVLQEALSDSAFAGTWRGELQYGWSFDEE